MSRRRLLISNSTPCTLNLPAPTAIPRGFSCDSPPRGIRRHTCQAKGAITPAKVSCYLLWNMGHLRRYAAQYRTQIKGVFASTN